MFSELFLWFLKIFFGRSFERAIMITESGVMDVGWIEDLEVTTEQNGKSATELQIENELPIDRWIDIAYDENGDEIADDETEMLQAQEAIRMEFTSIPAIQPDTNPHRRILKRELQAEALKRLESSARTEQEFTAVTEWWDRLDRNRERRERSYEISRGDVPLEHEMSQDGSCFPRWLANPTFRQICRGNFWDYFACCPFEMHNLTAKEYIREIVMNLKLEHKEILFFLGIRLYSPKKLAALRGQTDRNVRKVRDVVRRKIQRKLYTALMARRQNGASMTLQEKEFMAQYESAQAAKKMSIAKEDTDESVI